MAGFRRFLISEGARLPNHPDPDALYLGIDAGGTRCRARLVDGAGKVLGEGESGPANLRIGTAQVRGRILAAAASAAEAAGLTQDVLSRTSAAAGIAGTLSEAMRKELAALDWPFASLRIETDAHIAQLGAHGGGDGAVLILGTGSIGYIRQGGESITIGGHGFPVSDEGSGAALGLAAARHALRALDGRETATPFSREVTEMLGGTLPALLAWTETAQPSDYARLATTILRHAEEGDEAALPIVQQAARDADQFLATIYRRGDVACALMGGVAPHIRRYLSPELTSRVVEPKADAVSGALLLAGAPV